MLLLLQLTLMEIPVLNDDGRHVAHYSFHAECAAMCVIISRRMSYRTIVGLSCGGRCGARLAHFMVE